MAVEIKPYGKKDIPAVLDFERRLRREEAGWDWDIGPNYQKKVKASFDDTRFDHSVSLLAWENGQVVGRIDASLICSHFDGSVKAYLDWICVVKSCRGRGVAQALMARLRACLRQKYQVDTLIALMAEDPSAQRFYRAMEGTLIRDQGIWIDC